MTDPADQPARHGRSLVGFYVALGVVAVLVGLGVLLYQPLRLRYAIHRVEHAPQLYFPPIHPCAKVFVADKWLIVCLDAARGGNRRAIEVIIDHAGVTMPRSPLSEEMNIWGPDVAYLAAEAQPESFFEALDRRDNQQTLQVLEAVRESSYGDSGLRYGTEGGLPREVFLAESLEYLAGSGDAQARRVAQAALDFTRRRFARELAEAEEAEKRTRAQAGGTTKP